MTWVTPTAFFRPRVSGRESHLWSTRIASCGQDALIPALAPCKGSRESFGSSGKPVFCVLLWCFTTGFMGVRACSRRIPLCPVCARIGFVSYQVWGGRCLFRLRSWRARHRVDTHQTVAAHSEELKVHRPFQSKAEIYFPRSLEA